jgi:hypothetical protein
MSPVFQIIIVVVAIVVAAGLAAKPLLGWLRRRQTKQAIDEFRMRREVLEAKFFDLASRQGKPRGLRWSRCDWQPAVTFGRDVETKLLTAFVSVELHFEAIEGGDMEDVEAVGTIRDATAVFHYEKGRWGTGGKALFNMNPDDALRRLEGQFEPVAVSTR